MIQTKWQKRGNEIDPKLLEQLKEETQLSEFILSILISRGFTTKEAIDEYLHPEIKMQEKVYLTTELIETSNKVIEAIKNSKQITIYGDYDCDGTVATALLYRYLKEIGAPVNYYIPNRLTEGYGLNKEAIKKLKDSGTDTIITVDNGIAAVDEVAYMKELGMTVIITDHHEPQEIIPEADTILDFKYRCSDPFFKEACGAGVALLLIFALDETYHLLNRAFSVFEFMDLAAIATIADVVPLQDFNRFVTKISLNSINEDGLLHWGFKELIRLNRLRTIDSTTVAFRLAPMINASGRLGKVDDVMKFLTASDLDESKALARVLYDRNTERSRLQRRVEQKALEQIEKENLDEDDCIIVVGKNWHDGIIGIVASRIQNTYYKPVILISVNDEGIGHASARSIEGFNLFEALSQVKDLFTKFGGHEQAAGFTIEEKNIPTFKERLKDYLKTTNIKNYFIKQFNYDIVSNYTLLNKEDVKNLDLLEPFGKGNPDPVLKFTNKQVTDFRLIGSEREHIKFKSDGIDCIGFGFGHFYPGGLQGTIDFLAKPEINCYNYLETVQLNVQDLKLNPFSDFPTAEKLLYQCVEGEEAIDYLIYEKEPFQVSRDQIKIVYQLAKKSGNRGFSVNSYTNKTGHSVLTLAAILRILKEASLLDYSYQNFVLYCRLIPTAEKKDLTKTKTFQFLNQLNHLFNKN